MRSTRKQQYIKLVVMEAVIAAILIAVWYCRIRYVEVRQSVYIGSMDQSFIAPFEQITGISVYYDGAERTQKDGKPVGATVIINEPGDIEDIVWMQYVDRFSNSESNITDCTENENRLEIGHEYNIRLYSTADLYMNMSARVYGGEASYLPIYRAMSIYILLAAAALWFLVGSIMRQGSSVRQIWASAFVSICILGLLICVAIPYLNVPDERIHFAASYQISNKALGRGELTDDQTIYVDELNILHHYSEQGTYDYWCGTTQGSDTGRHVSKLIYTGGYPFYIQIPSATAITLARIANAPWQIILMSGRMMNLIMYAAIVALAVTLCPVIRGTLMSVALFPTSLWLGASYSYDSILIACALLFIAACVRGRVTDRGVGWKAILAIAVLGMIMTPIKVIYATLLLMILMIPGHRFAMRHGRLMACIVVWGSALLITFMLQWDQIYPLVFTNQMDERGIQSEIQMPERLYASADETIDMSEELTTNQEAPNWVGEEIQISADGDEYVNYSASYCLRHPIYTLWTLCNTLVTNIDVYMQELIDGTQRYLIICGVIILLCYVRIVTGEIQDHVLCSNRMRAFAAAIFITTILLIVASMLVGFNTVPASGLAVINGIQGRYFLPILPLLAIVFARLDPLSENHRVLLLRIESMVVLLGIILNFYVYNRA